MSIPESYSSEAKYVAPCNAPTTAPLLHHQTYTLSEDKRCMLVSAKPRADFSRGCAHPAMQPSISTTHPYPACAENIKKGSAAVVSGDAMLPLSASYRYRAR